MKEFNLKDYAIEINNITTKEKDNYIDYSSIANYIRDLMKEFNLVEIDEKQGAIFAADVTKTRRLPEQEGNINTISNYLRYILDSVKMKWDKVDKESIKIFADSFVSLVAYVFPIPMQSKYRQFLNKTSQGEDYKDIFNEKYPAIDNFIHHKQFFIKEIIKLCYFYKFFNLGIDIFREHKDYLNFQLEDLYECLFTSENMYNVYLEHVNDKCYEEYNKMKSKYKKEMDDSLEKCKTVEEILDWKNDDKLEKECHNLLKIGFINVISNSISLHNLIFLYEFFHGESFEMTDYWKYIESLFNNFIKSYEAYKSQINKIYIESVEKSIDEIQLILDEHDKNYISKLFGKIYGSLGSICKIAEFSDEMKYWLSVLEAELNIDPHTDVLHSIENIIFNMISNKAINMPFDEKKEKALEFFEMASIGNPNRNIKNIANYKELSITCEKCVDNICKSISSGNITLLNIIAGSQSFFEEYKNISFCADYTFLFVSIVKAFERYLKEIIIQNSPSYIPKVYNFNIENPDVYHIRPELDLMLTSDLLSNGEKNFRHKDKNNRNVNSSCDLELGTACWTLKAIINKPINGFTDRLGIFINRNNERNFPIKEEFVDTIRNGHFHINCVTTFEDAKDLYVKTAYWFKAVIETFDNFELKEYVLSNRR